MSSIGGFCDTSALGSDAVSLVLSERWERYYDSFSDDGVMFVSEHISTLAKKVMTDPDIRVTITRWDGRSVTPELTSCLRVHIEPLVEKLLTKPVEDGEGDGVCFFCDDDDDEEKCEEALCAVLSIALAVERDPIKLGKLLEHLPKKWQEHALKELFVSLGSDAFEHLMISMLDGYSDTITFPYSSLQKILKRLPPATFTNHFLLVVSNPVKHFPLLFEGGVLKFHEDLLKWALSSLETARYKRDFQMEDLCLTEIKDEEMLKTVLASLPFASLNDALICTGYRDKTFIEEQVIVASQENSIDVVQCAKKMTFDKEMVLEIQRYAVAYNNPFGGFQGLFDETGSVRVSKPFLDSVLIKLRGKLKQSKGTKTQLTQEARLNLKAIQDEQVLLKVLAKAQVETVIDVMLNRGFERRENFLQAAYYLAQKDLAYFLKTERRLGLSSAELHHVKFRLAKKDPLQNIELCFENRELLFDHGEFEALIRQAALDHIGLREDGLAIFASFLKKIPLRFHEMVFNVCAEELVSEQVYTRLKEGLCHPEHVFHIFRILLDPCVTSVRDKLAVCDRLLPEAGINLKELEVARGFLALENETVRARCFDLLSSLYEIRRDLHSYDFQATKALFGASLLLLVDIAKISDLVVYNQMKSELPTLIHFPFGGFSYIDEIARLPLGQVIPEPVLKEFLAKIYPIAGGGEPIEFYMAKLEWLKIENPDSRQRAIEIGKSFRTYSSCRVPTEYAWVYSFLIPQIARCRNEDLRRACLEILQDSIRCLNLDRLRAYRELLGENVPVQHILPLWLLQASRTQYHSHLGYDPSLIKLSEELTALRGPMKDKLSGLSHALNLACLEVAKQPHPEGALNYLCRALQFKDQIDLIDESEELSQRHLSLEKRAQELKERKKALRLQKKTFQKRSLHFLGKQTLRLPIEEKLKLLEDKPSGLRLMAYQMNQEEALISQMAMEIEANRAKLIEDTRALDLLKLGKIKTNLVQLTFLLANNYLPRIPEAFTGKSLSELGVYVWEHKYGVDASGIEDFARKFATYFDKGRMKGMAAAYTGKEDPAVRGHFSHLVRQTLLGNYKTLRYQVTTPHLELIASNFPDVYQKWQQGSAKKTLLGVKIESQPLTQEAVRALFENALSHDHFESNPVFEPFIRYLKTGEVPEKETASLLTVGFIEAFNNEAPNLETLKGLLKLYEKLELPDLQVIADIKGLIQKTRLSERSDETYVVDTDELDDLFLCGTEVEFSCQRVMGSVGLNKCLLGYVTDGKNRMIAVKDKNGKIIARRIFRLLIDKDNNPVLFLEKLYGANSHKIQQAILRMAMNRAKQMNIPLYERGVGCGGGVLRSLGSNAPFEYCDAATTHIADRGVYEIEHTRLIT